MALDHLIKKARQHFGIRVATDWANVRPEWILAIPGCGPSTLSHIRLYLLPHGITLKDDATPEFWAANLGALKIGGQITDGDTLRTEPFTIIVDTAEKHPWTFTNMKVEGEITLTPWIARDLGTSHGDYSVVGCENEIHIERKSIDDAIGTFLSHGERGDAWQATIEFLAEIPVGIISIEGSFGNSIGSVKARGRRPVDQLRRQFFSRVHAWSMDYGLRFFFYDSRRLAEMGAFYMLRRYWLQKHHLKRQSTGTDSIDEVIASL